MSTANFSNKQRDPLSYKPQRDTLSMVGRYHYVTSRQVTRLLFRQSIHNYSQKILRELTRTGYLYDLNFIPKDNKSPGRPEYVWSLTPKGRSALMQMDESLDIRIPHDPEKTEIHLRHAQAVADAMITAELFAREQPVVFLSGFEHELSLKRLNIKVPTQDSKHTTVTPDGWIHFTIADGNPGGVLLELDRGTEDRPRWQTKVRNLHQLIRGGANSLYRQHFGADPLQIAVVVRSVETHRIKGPEKRLHDLLAWTEDVFKDVPQWGNYFAMTALDPLDVTPTEFYTGSHWFRPFAKTPTFLINPERLQP